MLVAISSVSFAIHAVFFALSTHQLCMERHVERSKLTDIQFVMPRAILVASLLQIAYIAVAITSQVSFCNVLTVAVSLACKISCIFFFLLMVFPI
jgi:hypothetical protein